MEYQRSCTITAWINRDTDYWAAGSFCMPFEFRPVKDIICDYKCQYDSRWGTQDVLLNESVFVAC